MNDHLRIVVDRYIEEGYPSTCRHLARTQQELMHLTINNAVVVFEKLEVRQSDSF